ncbi:Xaa-Pro dipeptidase [Spinactinospora alkalitolerans]|uniref:Xaa-Pro dipeptidase n=1 Tax=Spinactinospora alkalitolerans TaxID=687207 RepID=A0A852TNU2_9ACTN|nr:Xaa-Pro peptidase family protein [Spinactinospora alkalitolerans]NYE45111.1 Xaa-Pro dipeptidase [Spinactinospora alkalitolerans]
MTAIADPFLPLPIRQSDPELTRRTDAARAEMARRDLAALLLVSPENIYYLLGLDHQGYFAFSLLLVPRDGAPELIARAMEGPTVAARAPGCVHRPFHDGEDPVAVVTAALRAHVAPGSAVGVEDSAMFFPPAIRTRICRETQELTWVDASDVGQRLREVKSDGEIAAVRRAAALSDSAMAAGIAAVAEGVRETRVAAAVYQAMISGGSQNPGFAPLIRSTAILQQEHVSWDERAIAAGDGVFLELSACVRRYHAPLSRTIYVGAAPPQAATAHAAALAGLAAIRDALRPGAVAGDVYAAWRAAVERVHPQGGVPRHHCGYLVGIGFPPSWVGGGEVPGIRPGSTRAIRAGMTFHAMSWVQEPIGYVVSDTALVTGEGCELLTGVSRELTVVP